MYTISSRTKNSYKFFTTMKKIYNMSKVRYDYLNNSLFKSFKHLNSLTSKYSDDILVKLYYNNSMGIINLKNKNYPGALYAQHGAGQPHDEDDDAARQHAHQDGEQRGQHGAGIQRVIRHVDAAVGPGVHIVIVQIMDRRVFRQGAFRNIAGSGLRTPTTADSTTVWNSSSIPKSRSTLCILP